MTIDRISDVANRDEQRVEHDTLQSEVRRLRTVLTESRLRVWILSGVVMGLSFFSCRWQDRFHDAESQRDAAIHALDVERARYLACMSDREDCIDVGHGWTLCMPGGER